MIKIATVQGAPKCLDLTGTRGKMRPILEDAADNGCQPDCISQSIYTTLSLLRLAAVLKKLFPVLSRNSLRIPGSAIAELSRRAKEAIVPADDPVSEYARPTRNVRITIMTILILIVFQLGRYLVPRNTLAAQIGAEVVSWAFTLIVSVVRLAVEENPGRRIVVLRGLEESSPRCLNALHTSRAL
jgi:hypothetical protein